jgi:hypothetical protein
VQRSRRPVPPINWGFEINCFIGIKFLLGPCFGAKEPPPGTPDQAGLRIKTFIGIRILLEPGFGAKSRRLAPPIKQRFERSFIGIIILLETGVGAKEPLPGTPDCKHARSSWRKRTRCERDEPAWLKKFHEDDRTGRFGEDAMTLV